MMKRLLWVALSSVIAGQAFAWPAWDTFKVEQLQSGRVIDFNDERLITTSEGQSYALFFALVADDQKAFAEMLSWTEKHLAKGQLSKNLPAWLWGERPTPAVIDTNNALDSDMWIAYCLLEAGRLWNKSEYTEKGLALLKLLETQVREIAHVGKVLLPGHVGFEKNGNITINSSYYPLFLLRRFAQEDASWQAVFDGCLRATLQSAPNGFAPDWATFDKDGNLTSTSDPIGSYNAIRVYLWAGMMSTKDPVRRVLKDHFAPMIRLTESLNLPPEKVDTQKLQANHVGPVGFGACLLPLMDKNAHLALIRTYLTSTPIVKDNYYQNVLMLFAQGYDKGLYRFDEMGFLHRPKIHTETTSK